MWIVYAGLILLLFTSFGAKNQSTWKPIRYITLGILGILFLTIGYEWWVYIIVFALVGLITLKLYIESHGNNKWTKLSVVSLIVLIVASAGITIADFAVTQSVVKTDDRLQELTQAFSYDYTARIEGYTYIEDGFSIDEYPEPYIRYFVSADEDGRSMTLKSSKYSGMFLNKEKLNEIHTAIVVVRRYGAGNTYDVYRNGVKTNGTESIYQQEIDLYFFNLDTHEYTYLDSVVSGKIPNKNGGGQTRVSKAKAFKALRAIYR